MAINVKTEQLTGIVVSHTHWDREWYLSFQRFRMMLVDAIDALLDILDQDPSFRYFTLDGQTIVLEDYLEIRPENEARLARYIGEGRLLIGPWYILPDEFLASAESLVHNLLISRKTARRFGHTMAVGYLPDTFGHPAQMPQILRRWGFDNAVLFRGVIPPASEFIWEAPDGSQVLTVFMPGGYCNAAGMAASPDRFLQGRLADVVANLRAMATTSNILLMNGCDHFPPRRRLADYIEKGNAQFEDVVLHQGTLPQYIEAVKAAKPTLQVVTGEFRAPRPGRVTPGVLSARMYLKQQNFEASNLLERYAEPLAALSYLAGFPHPDAYLTLAWQQVLQNQPHDSICGCSVDPVHRDMLTRFHYAEDVGGEIVRRALAEIGSVVATGMKGDGARFLIFNPAGTPREDYTRQLLHFIDRDRRDFRILDGRGKVVPHQVVSRRDMIVQYQTYSTAIELDGRAATAMPVVSGEQMAELVNDGLWQRWDGEEVEILVHSKLPGAGFATFEVAAVDGEEGMRLAEPRQGTDLRAGEDWLENDLLQLEVDNYGRISLLDKRTDVMYGPLNVFENGGDRGDEYTYCPPEEDVVITSAVVPAVVRLVETGPVRATLEIATRLRVPRRLTADRGGRDDRSVELPIVSRVSLIAGSPRVEIVTEVENAAEDHRLRAVFNAPLITDWSHAHGQFEVTRRAIDLDPAEVGRAPGNDEEVAVTTFPQATFVDVNDGECGLAVLNRGLPEYEALRVSEGTAVALTLLRCVGWLSRPDLSTRFGNAGPMLQTPEAHCPGKHVFRYAVVPHAKGWAQAEVAEEAARFAGMPIGSSLVARPRHNGVTGLPANPRPLPGKFSFVTVTPSTVQLSALKKADDSDGIIVRVYNAAQQPVTARLSFDWPLREAVTVSLAEEALALPAIDVEDGGLSFELGPCEIRTLLVR